MENEIYELAKLHLKDKLSNKELSLKLGKSSSWCVERLKRHGLYVYKPELVIHKKGDLKKEIEKLKESKWQQVEEIINKPSFFEKGKDYIAVCKMTGDRFRDYKNQSGSLSEFLRRTVDKIDIPSARERREYRRRNNGKPWMSNFFYYEEVQAEKKEELKCKECDYATTDRNNNAGFLTKHIKKEHDISISEYVGRHVEHKKFFKTALEKENYAKRYDGKKEGVDFIRCKICNQKMSKINNKHLEKHQMSLLDYKMKFGTKEIYGELFLKKVKDAYDNGLASYESKYMSSGQKFIFEELKKTFKKNIHINNKSLLNGVEIDILIPERKLGIEFNGLYYHSEISGKKNRQYHKSKTKLMNSEGYKLIHVFEDEWIHKPSLVMSKINSAAGISVNSRKIHARKCFIREITKVQKNEFLNLYHIQGEDRSDVHLGAFYNDELISVMTFDESRSMNPGKTTQIELKRFCVKTNVICVGIFGKIFKSYLKENRPSFPIVSFADLRWTLNVEENIYVKNNFFLDKTLPPDYTYLNSAYSRGKRMYKYSFGKKALKKKFPEAYSDLKSEWEIMREVGFDRIWDCGKARFVYDRHM